MIYLKRLRFLACWLQLAEKSLEILNFSGDPMSKVPL